MSSTSEIERLVAELPPVDLSSMNEQQRAAVTAPGGVVCVVAGPGSGKTRVIVHRVAHLIQTGTDPRTILLVTFTNKAAAEMKSRLQLLVQEPLAKLVMAGTFHSVCARFLRRHARDVGLSSNFSIIDTEDVKALLKRVIQELKDTKWPKGKPRDVIEVRTCMQEISKWKNQNVTPQEARVQLQKKTAQHYEKHNMAHAADVFEAYERNLRASNLLDFDDLMLFGLRLFRTNERVLAPYTQALVDEFQDTNKLQFSMAETMFRTVHNITVVGDPDQSIYGFRFAEPTSFKRIQEIDPARTTVISLIQNYRSTNSVLRLARTVISSKSNAESLELFTENGDGVPATFLQAQDPDEEARVIAYEIMRLVRNCNLKFSDFAILVRVNAMTRAIETALASYQLPYRMVGGLRFFDRKEIRDCVALLRLVSNPSDFISFERVANVPKRGVGDSSISKIIDEALMYRTNPLGLIMEHDRVTGMNVNAWTSLQTFCELLLDCRMRHMSGKLNVRDMLHTILTRIGYFAHLEATEPDDYKTRIENVNELLAIAARFDAEGLSAAEVVSLSTQRDANQAQAQATTQSATTPNPAAAAPEAPAKKLTLKEKTAQKARQSALYRSAVAMTMHGSGRSISEFAELVSLQSSTDSAETADAIVVSTLHAAKGLEWACVFLPGVEEMMLPHYMAVSTDNPESIAEEKRLLYVGVTRSQFFVYLSACTSRYTGAGHVVYPDLSRFLSSIVDSPRLPKSLPFINDDVKSALQKVVKRHGDHAAPSSSVSDASLRAIRNSSFVLRESDESEIVNPDLTKVLALARAAARSAARSAAAAAIVPSLVSSTTAPPALYDSSTSAFSPVSTSASKALQSNAGNDVDIDVKVKAHQNDGSPQPASSSQSLAVRPNRAVSLPSTLNAAASKPLIDLQDSDVECTEGEGTELVKPKQSESELLSNYGGFSKAGTGAAPSKGAHGAKPKAAGKAASAGSPKSNKSLQSGTSSSSPMVVDDDSEADETDRQAGRTGLENSPLVNTIDDGGATASSASTANTSLPSPRSKRRAEEDAAVARDVPLRRGRSLGMKRPRLIR
ncbi:ATP-dependent DNA helicase Rep [Capsaspora owczarzaki ATCC 30864]|uniref:DNA 3'-5' helicase n=1 Tax=Capsaspora owczarzaki (strain ATCC 30864) TaxID=595528 RepID=A0A0D2UB56_CAPO3|nr:ATP-dependent DNA helicase Rep [Capsaspora owczarzaki ATCC 30864]KJE92281.1 ATP-dependent DNA helicase Rep [Capsaspora owczarzaki ATCC 30864]|eukprot:XP_004364121.1 ATP-dependent DNA helicase Rep [Capsaspora owczarzaki ATCC 30864]